MSWAHWPLNNCLGTLASHHCNNTLFKNGGSKPRCYKVCKEEEFLDIVHSDVCGSMSTSSLSMRVQLR
jgi:hypothetical protein